MSQVTEKSDIISNRGFYSFQETILGMVPDKEKNLTMGYKVTMDLKNSLRTKS